MTADDPFASLDTDPASLRAVRDYYERMWREAEATITRVRELHNADGSRGAGFPRVTGVEHYCTHCQHSAPCPTIAALDGEGDQ